ncbi:MAG: lamin tail domain-containing protein [Candidatus Woesearchaeota archaeon]
MKFNKNREIKTNKINERINCFGKIILALMLSIFCCSFFSRASFAEANSIIITEVLYNPTGSENCREAVEIYNPTNNDVDIGNWYLKTKSSSKDAAIPAGTIIKSKSYFLIADSNWSNCKDSYWPYADREESITLANSDGGVSLMDNNDQRIDSVCWGIFNEEFCEGEPTVVVSEGNSISRKTIEGNFIDTENNSFDFYEIKPNLRNSNSSQELLLEVSFNIVEEDFSITNVSITDDLEREGFQVLPKPNSDRIITISAKTTTNNANLECSVEGLGKKSMILENNSYVANFSIPYYFEPKNYSVVITALHNNKTINYNAIFSFEELLAIMIDTKNIDFGNLNRAQEKIILGDYDTETIQKPTIKNIGNVNADVVLAGSDFYKNSTDFPNGMIMYSFTEDFSDFYGLLNETRMINLGIKPSEKMPLNFKIYVPENQELGTYYGSIMIEMIKSQ